MMWMVTLVFRNRPDCGAWKYFECVRYVLADNRAQAIMRVKDDLPDEQSGVLEFMGADAKKVFRSVGNPPRKLASKTLAERLAKDLKAAHQWRLSREMQAAKTPYDFAT